MKKTVLIGSMIILLGTALYSQSKEVRIQVENEIYIIEVSEVKREGGRLTITLTSESISGSIGMSVSAMFPFVACAVLEDGTIIDPIPLKGGVVGGSGWDMNEPKVLAKTPGKNALGRWSNAVKGYLQYCFDTQESIKDVLIGTYADYAVSAYKNFSSSSVSYTKGS
jgi:hypothetical protein